MANVKITSKNSEIEQEPVKKQSWSSGFAGVFKRKPKQDPYATPNAVSEDDVLPVVGRKVVQPRPVVKKVEALEVELEELEEPSLEPETPVEQETKEEVPTPFVDKKKIQLVAEVPEVEKGSIAEAVLKAGSMIQALELLIDEAYVRRASDIHIDPYGDGVLVRYRIDGVLAEVCRFPKTDFNELVTRVKVVANLRTDEHQAAQDGRFRHISGGEPVDVRVSIVPTYYGENAVLRLLASKREDYSLESLGFTEESRAKLVQAIKKPYGMILATGPTGSGKTTTLYTLLQMLNTPEISIVTIEDPVEYAIEGIEQIQVNARTNLTFANGLRAILRQDPNVIMVGEIRDQETAGLAVNTALTGHLVLSTLHTNDAATTLPRLLDLKVEPYLIASTVNVAIGQRLVRKICKFCRTRKKLSVSESRSLSTALPGINLNELEAVYEGSGCEKCSGMGYMGRVGIHEVLVLDQPVREAILQKASATKLRGIAMQSGMVPMLLDGYHKVREGITTISEVLRMLYD